MRLDSCRKWALLFWMAPLSQNNAPKISPNAKSELKIGLQGVKRQIPLILKAI
jgi:hypothetical protein